MRKFWIKAFLFLIIWVCIPRIESKCQSPDRFETLFQSFVNKDCFKHSVVGVYVADLQTGTELLSKNAEISLPPASVLKILTTGAALQRFGPAYTYITELIVDGTVIGDTLFGDLIIRGNGDPTLGSTRFNRPESFDRWVENCASLIKSKNIRVIDGSVIADASCYRVPGVGESWSYNDLGNYYGAGVYGLNVYDNSYRVVFRQNPVEGGLTRVEDVIPEIPGFDLSNYVVSGPRGSGDQAYIFCAPFQFNAFVKGTIPAGSGTFEIKGSIPNPPLLAAQNISGVLLDSGIIVTGSTDVLFESYNYRKPQILSMIRSPEMSEIVRVINTESVNLYAEGIGQELALLMGAESSGDAISKHWVDRKVDFSGCHIEDASGLAPDNAVTAKAVVDILRDLINHRQYGDLFKNSLASFGVSGTVDHLLRRSPAKGKILAKSGSINRVRNQAGLILTETNGIKVFCVLTYNFHCNPREATRAIASFLESLYLLYSE